MRAAVVRQPGATPVLEQFTDPQPGPGVSVGTLVAAPNPLDITGIRGHPLTLMTASDTAPRHCASRRSCHHQCLIRDPHSGHLLTLQNPAPRLGGHSQRHVT